MYNKYNNTIDKIEFGDDYKEKLMDTLTNYTKNKNYNKFKRTVLGNILLKKKIRKVSFVLVILLVAFVSLSTKPIQAAIQNVFSYFIEGVYHNYETNLSNNKDEINQSVTVDGITMNIYEKLCLNSHRTVPSTSHAEQPTCVKVFIFFQPSSS